MSGIFTCDSFKVSLAESFDGELIISYKVFLSICSFSSLLLFFCFFLRSAEVRSKSGAALVGTSGGGDCMIRGGLDPADKKNKFREVSLGKYLTV